MKKTFVPIIICFLLFLYVEPSFGKGFEVVPARIFGRTNKEVAALLVNGKIALRLYGSSESGISAFDRIEKTSAIMNYLLKKNISIGSSEPVSTAKGASVFVGSLEVLSVEPADTINTYMPPLLIAFNWANRLRWAFGEPLLSQRSIDEIIRAEKLRGHDIEVSRNIWGDKAEVIVDGRVVMRFSENDPDLSAYDSAREIALSMEEGLSEGKTGDDIRPVISKGNQYSVRLGDSILSVVKKEEELIYKKDYWNIALERANKIREAFGVEPFSVGNIRSIKTQYGKASWYGGFFHGRRAASGERYNMEEFTAAHKTLPFGTEVLVTRLDNSKSVLVRVTDRGPYIAGRIIDLSRAAAESIGLLGAGVTKVRIDILNKPDNMKGK
ncbi:MAG: septal ring lytic transglycosylase RlpA family protein [Candidatus Margulisiibacteriota bacterium]